MELNFAVVEWVDYDPLLVSIVPSNWLVREKKKLFSYWSPRPVDDTIVKKRSPPQKNWPKYEVKLLGSAAQYSGAIVIRNKAECRSDVEAESATDDKKSRHERCRVSLEVDEVTEPPHKASKIKESRTVPALPSVPVGLRSAALSSARSDMSKLARRKIDESASESPVPYNVPSSVAVQHVGETVPFPACRDSQLSLSVPRMPSSTPLRGAGSVTPARVSNEGISMVLADLTKQVADIKERVTFNTQLLQEVVRQQKRGNDKDKIKLPCDMPLNSYEAVLEIEQKLKSKEFYSQLVSYLSVIGGATVKDFISRTMNKLLHPDLARTFVWAGRLTRKHGFKQLELASVLSDAARKNSLTSRATVAEIEQEMKIWLRGAPDRHGGRAKRSQRKARQHRKTLRGLQQYGQSRSRSARRMASPSPRRSKQRSNRSARRTASPPLLPGGLSKKSSHL